MAVKSVEKKLSVRGGFPVLFSAKIEVGRDGRAEVIAYEVKSVKGGSVGFLKLVDKEVSGLVDRFFDSLSDSDFEES